MIISIEDASWKTNIPFLKLISIFRIGLSAEFDVFFGIDIVCAFISSSMSASADQRSVTAFTNNNHQIIEILFLKNRGRTVSITFFPSDVAKELAE